MTPRTVYSDPMEQIAYDVAWSVGHTGTPYRDSLEYQFAKDWPCAWGKGYWEGVADRNAPKRKPTPKLITIHDALIIATWATVLALMTGFAVGMWV